MTNRTDPHRLARLRQHHSPSLGRELQTQVEVHKGAADALLTAEAVKRIMERADGSELAWHNFAQGPNDVVVAALAERHLAEVALMRAAAQQVIAEHDQSREIGELEEELFNYYDPSLYHAAVRRKMQQVEAFELPPDLEPARAILLDELQGYAGGTDERLDLEEPARRTLEVMRDWLEDQFGDVLGMVDSDYTKEHDASSVVRYFQNAIDSTPVLRDNNWKAEVVVREKSAISVYADQKKVVVPSHRTVTPETLKQLIVHEVFGHALRSAAAESHELTVGQYGTATYARFEESFMIALEQCLSGTYDPTRGVSSYFAVGLAVTDGLPKDDIARIVASINMLGRVKKDTPHDEGVSPGVIEAAMKPTKLQVQRVFAGMTDVDAGIAHRKDIDYLHGLDGSWRLLNYIVEHDIVNEAMPWLMAAKFNPFEAAERAYVSQKAPMPLQLEAFFTEAA